MVKKSDGCIFAGLFSQRIKNMKKIFRGIICSAALACSAVALEVTELPNEGLTREYADRNFSKDYEYVILEDNTVRRIWQADGYSLVLDFDIRSSKLICLYVDYSPAMEKKTAMLHAEQLSEGRDEGVKWIKTKEKSARKVGMKDARLLRLTDGSFLFWESAGASGACERLIWFAEAPRMDRMTVKEANRYTGRTAMGVSGVSGAVEELRRDEDRRRGRASTPRPEPIPANTEPVEQPEPAAAEQGKAAPAVQPTDTDWRSAVKEKFGIEVTEDMEKWAMYIGIGLLVLFIWGRISAARHRAKQAAAFEALLRAGEKDDNNED